jgi:hypothetical protein
MFVSDEAALDISFEVALDRIAETIAQADAAAS